MTRAIPSFILLNKHVPIWPFMLRSSSLGKIFLLQPLFDGPLLLHLLLNRTLLLQYFGSLSLLKLCSVFKILLGRPCLNFGVISRGWLPIFIGLLMRPLIFWPTWTPLVILLMSLIDYLYVFVLVLYVWDFSSLCFFRYYFWIIIFLKSKYVIVN